MTRIRMLQLAVVVAAGCVGREERAVAPPPGSAPAPVAGAAVDRCEPMPKEGEDCAEGDGYCVISWGSPGGHSTALWCRDGRWQVEHERNLPQ